MTDEEVLFKGIKFCNSQISCSRCPLRGKVCITHEGKITFGKEKTHLSFVEFTEQFRDMIKILEERTY